MNVKTAFLTLPKIDVLTSTTIPVKGDAEIFEVFPFHTCLIGVDSAFELVASSIESFNLWLSPRDLFCDNTQGCQQKISGFGFVPPVD